MILRLSIAMALLSGLTSGCGQVAVFGRTIGEKPASQASAAATAAPESAAPSAKMPASKLRTDMVEPIPTIKSVTLTLAPQVAAQVADDARFNREALLTAVRSELQLRKLLNEADSRGSAVDITIDAYGMRPTSNAIVFGNIVSAGTLSGRMQLRDAQGNELPIRNIESAAQVSIPATGQSANPLARLYREFAVVTANSIDGTLPKPVIGADQHPR